MTRWWQRLPFWPTNDAPNPSTFSEQIAWLRRSFGTNFDFTVHEFEIGGQAVAFAYFRSLVDGANVQKDLVAPLLSAENPNLEQYLAGLRPVYQLQEVSDPQSIRQQLLSGCTLLLIAGREAGGAGRYWLAQTPRILARSIEESPSEFVSRGPRDGFVEDVQVNLGLVRKRLKGVDVKTESFMIGQLSLTTCVLVYLEGAGGAEYAEKLRSKLNHIRTDAVFDTGQLEELLEEHPLSPFEEYINTDKPDKVAAELLGGRVGLFVDGSPTAILGPATFFNHLSSPADHYDRAISSSFHRLLRLGGFFLSAHLSALYLSLVTYHTHLIPIKLVEILMSKREQVPFPPLFEIFIMQIMIDLVLEAILRLPTKLGQIIGVAGAIIIGQAAISAHLISPGVIIVVSITTIAGYAMPRLSTAYSVQILRYVNLFLTVFLGGYGLLVSMMFWLIHLAQLSSLGHAYLTPLSPFHWSVMRDTVIRFPKRWLGPKEER
jgi:hypothetical protein